MRTGQDAGRYSRPLMGGRYTVSLEIVLLASVVFTLTDFATSFFALNKGFSEGNPLLNGLSGTLSLGTISSLFVTKAIFIAGVSSLAVVGDRSKDRITKKLMLASLAVLVILFACVSLNNLYWLVS